jgi:NitT/TauT family transport system substrate-binding protein
MFPRGTGWLSGLALAGALAIGSSGCAKERDRLVLGRLVHPATALVLVAGEERFYEAEGLDLVVRDFAAGRDALDALLRGELDVACAYETPVVIRSFEDSRIRVLSALHRSMRNTGLVARPDRGVHAPEDLRGKAIAVPRNTNAELFLETLLGFSGVGRDQVSIKDTPPERLASALRSGEVDAVAAWRPYLDEARVAAGEDAPVLHSDVYTEMSMLVTRDDVAAGRQRALVKLVRALSRAERVLREDPERAFGDVARAMPTLDPAIVRSGLENVKAELGLHHLMLAVMDDEAEWLQAHGRVRGPAPVLRRLLAPAALEEVDPEAVTVEEVR